MRRKNQCVPYVAVLLLVLGQSVLSLADSPRKPDFQHMAAVEQYQMASRDDEVAMARSAAPASISGDAEILVMGTRGYETAIQGKNGFTCLVMRSWAASFGDPEFWNPKIRSPICYNAAAVRTVLPIDLEKTKWVLAGVPESEMRAKSKASKAVLTVPAPGAMSYMMSRQQHLSDTHGHWHPHVMIYEPHTAASAWGANTPDSPILAFEGEPDESAATVFVVPVDKWSDGSAGSAH